MISEKQLLIAAKELIEDVCALRDDKTKKPIVINSEMSVEDITTLFKNAITLIEPTDKFSDATKAVIDEMAKNGDGKEEAAEEKEKEEPPEIELTLAEEIESATTLKELKAIALVEDSFKTIKGRLSSYKKVEDLKEGMLELLKNEEEEAQKKAEELHKKNIGDAPVRTGRGKAPAAKDEASDKKEKKPADPGKKTTLAEKIDFFTPLVKSGKYTQKDLVELAVKEFPKLTKSTFQTFLTDGKNPKYSKFNPLLATNADGKMIFAKK